MGLMKKMKETEAPAPAPAPRVQEQLDLLEREAEKARAALAAQGKEEVPETGIVPPDAPPSEHPLPEEGKKGRGRPKGAKNKPKEESLPQEMFPANNPGNEPEKKGLLLEVYVDCIITCPTESMHTVLAKICRDLCDEHGCLDVRCAPSDSHLAFGRWKGYVAQRVEAWATTAAGAYTLDTRGSEIAEVAADVLRTAAPLFVRGIR